MKNFFLFILVAGITACSEAQPQAPALSASNPGWLVDLDEAYEISKKEGKPIMANFTGSDWCGWCKRLTASVFSKPEFQSWAEENVVLLELDFPRRKQLPQEYVQQNNMLRNSFKIAGYPTIWVFNAEKDNSTGKYKFQALGKTGYAPTVDQFTGAVERFIQ